MATVEINEVIGAPPQVVFRLIAQPELHPLWQNDLDSDGLVDGDGSGGSRGREVRRVMGRTIASEYEVTECVAPERWGYRSLAGPVSTEGVLTCTPSGDDTRVSARLTFFGWAGEAMARFARRQFAGHLRALKDLVESGAVPDLDVTGPAGRPPSSEARA